MGKNNLPPGAGFKKGQSGNPSGRPKLSAELALIKKLSREEVNAIFAKYARMSKEQMQEALKDSSLPSLELWICSGIINGIRNGDWYNLNIMFDRIFGKTLPINETPQLTNSQVIVTLPANGKEAITID